MQTDLVERLRAAHDRFSVMDGVQNDDLVAVLEAMRNAADAAGVDLCPVCMEPFKPGDTCATDIELGTCHAECLDGTPVVDLETGEPSAGPVATYPYEPLRAQGAPAGVGVKALEWRGTEGVWAKADALFGATYRITEYAGMAKPFKLETVGFAGPSGHYEFLDDAKAAAQADYERRILSALAPKEAEPVAWPEGFFVMEPRTRLYECATEGCGQRTSIRIERGGAGSNHCEPCARKIAAITAAHPAPEPAGLEKAVEAAYLGEMAKHPGWELSWGAVDPSDECSEYGWLLHERSGNINDREWNLRAAGETPLEALRAALPHLSPSPQAEGWRTMDSAPKTNNFSNWLAWHRKEGLCYTGWGRNPKDMIFFRPLRTNDAEWGWTEKISDFVAWMPLPASPTDGGRDG